MFSVPGADDRALEILVFAPRRAVGKLHWGEIVDFGPAVAPRVAVPRCRRVGQSPLLACWGCHSRRRPGRLGGWSIVQGVTRRVGKVSHQRIGETRGVDRKDVRRRP